jgi:valyl-tRNA synthetase
MESIPKNEQGMMHYFKYAIKDSSDYVEVATTRPETMYSDVALGMNPNHPKADKFKDKIFINPFGIELPVIFDDYISLDKGSGYMKVSAHATEDIRMIEENQLLINESIDDNGNLNELTGKYAGLDRLSARTAIIKDLEHSGCLIRSEDNDMEVPYSERSGALVEVMYKEQ